ncbi:serine hydrolase domain-containing protein [Rhodoferax sp.]|uniref:serine hydrolase domain-containing protein n=1 Tax=Rhodoferax sp. TaxID=50421 RepID=UPI00374D2877
MRPILALLPLVFLLASAGGRAAPDEAALGKAQNYPVPASVAQGYQEPFLVGSFSARDTVGAHCDMAPAAQPLPLAVGRSEPALRYRFSRREFTLDDYMQHQRATAVLVLKDGEIVAERYNYDRTPAMRMLSQSMAKTVVALAIGQALEEGRIRSLDDTAATYVPTLAGTLMGETRIIHLLRMASGARYVEDYSDSDDRFRFNAVARKSGLVAAARTLTERAEAAGQRFNYSSAQTEILGLVLQGATGQTLCQYVDTSIWQAMGAESAATWLLNPADHLALAAGGLNATVRDYARLGWLMANDGQAQGRAVLPRGYLLDMTDASHQPEAFRPGQMQNKGSTYYGYGLQTWILPGAHRRFALLGIHGQAVFVDPELKLVMVHTAVGKDAAGDASGNHLGAERDALWRGVVAQYGPW